MSANNKMHLLMSCSSYLLLILQLATVVHTWTPTNFAQHTQLANYDQAASSSSFGEPVFRLEPPNVINFANTKGATIPCLASGSPRPSITWFSSGLADISQQSSLVGDLFMHQTRPVTNVTNLRQIVHDGAAIRLLPFKESDFRQDIHFTEYRCVARNPLTTIHSRSVVVQAVMSSEPAAAQEAQVKVSDEFVALGAPAVFRCRPNSNAQLEFSQLVEWFTSDGLQIGAGETSKGNKFTAFKSGELHLTNVEMADLQRTYGCRLRNSVTRQVSSSSGLAQLILTDLSEERRAASGLPQVLHTTGQLVADDLISPSSRWAQQPQVSLFEQQVGAAETPADWRLLLPCAVRAPARSRLRWFYQPPGRSNEPTTPLEQWAAARGFPLVQLGDAGAGNSSGGALVRRPRTSRSRLVVGPTFLAIEWASRAQSGRYIGQLVSDQLGPQPESRDPEQLAGATVCDISVIVRQPLRLRLTANLSGSTDPDAAQPGVYEAYEGVKPGGGSVLRNALDWWFGRPHGEQVALRRRRHQAGAPGQPSDNPLLEADLRRVQVRGPGAVAPPPVARIGQRLQLDCWASGYPLESVRWFRNGQLINTQSSSDFQVEISATQAPREDGGADEQVLLSSLLIRQLQSKELGLSSFECFGQSSVGERARAGLALLVVDRPLVDWARAACPVPLDAGNASAPDAPEVPDEPEEAGFGWPAARPPAGLLRRHNPWQRALLLEAEPAELVCPRLSRVEWRRWEQAEEQQAAGEPRNSNFNQLFSGDSRFVINGSSLQIRSPSKRQDEALYVCRARLGEALTSQSGQQPGPSSQQRVHQSSLASSAPSCSALLAQTLFQTAPTGSDWLHMSSISIRIVAKPKIDPFEFSRNLEEGMRAVLVCTVISGQSPVDIRWFKDGQFFVAEDQAISLDQANSFSSTLTFHRIRPDHSGLYTCVAANAFAATHHTSRLVVNVAPYFIDPPGNTRAVLGSNVLINCRAAGEPSPQIRWRKLVPIGSNASTKMAPSGGGLPKMDYSDNAPDAQVAPPSQAASKFEFRVITSNSHIQILENGSMIIKEVELADSSRYVCQAFNGINPSLSEVIDLQVLSPAQFELSYETIGVKRDSMIKFNCAPRGDQPMQIEWRKEGSYLVAGNASESQRQQAKYSEIAHLVPLNGSSSGEQVEQQRHSVLMLQQSAPEVGPANGQWAVRSSELFINFADRADTGSFVCLARNPYGKDQLTYRLVVQEAPDVPLAVQAANVLANSMRLSWTSPFDGNLPISHYAVEYRKLSHQTSSASEWVRLVVSANKLAAGDQAGGSASSQLANSAAPVASASQTPGAAYSLILRQLAAKSAYHVRVAAVNAVGQGPFSPHLSVTTSEEPPSSRVSDLRTQPVTSSSLKVLWRGPAVIDEQAPVKGYYISHRRAGAGPSADLKEETGDGSDAGLWLGTATVSAANSSFDEPVNLVGPRGQLPVGVNYEHLLTGLEKNARYELRVQPYNSVGVGPASETVGQTLKFDRPGQPSLRLVAARRQSLELQWSLGNDKQPLMGFSLFYKCEYDDWQEIQLAAIYAYVVENLRCGNKYQIYLSAFNAVGRSDPSDVLSVRTEGTAPIAPDSSRFFKSNISELVLDMSGWKSGGCPISSFMIRFKRLHESNWFALSEGATPFASTDRITIPDLTPATWYKLTVTALNEAGSTNAEYVVSTLSAAGEPITSSFPLTDQHLAAAGGQSLWNNLGQLLLASGGGASSTGGVQSVLLPLVALLLLLVLTLVGYMYRGRSGRPKGHSNHSPSSSDASSSGQHQLGAAKRHYLGDGYGTGGPTLCDSMAPTDEKQLIQSSGHHQHQLHQLVNSSLLPLDGSNNQSGVPSGGSVLDSLVGGAGLHSFIGCRAGGGSLAARSQHGMKLLSSGNLFQSNLASNCTSASISTHSTSCMDGSSSSSGSAGAKAKLQLVDQSSLIEETLEEARAAEEGGYLHGRCQQSPQRALYGPDPKADHVDVLGGRLGELRGDHLFQESAEVDGRALYGQRGLSNSFASAAELVQRQQAPQHFYYQQPPQEEPVYQRLDRFQLAYGLPPGKQQQFAMSQAAKSQTLRFAPNHLALNESLKSMTIKRDQQQAYPEGVYAPQAAPSGFHDLDQHQQQAQQLSFEQQMSSGSEITDSHLVFQPPPQMS